MQWTQVSKRDIDQYGPLESTHRRINNIISLTLSLMRLAAGSHPGDRALALATVLRAQPALLESEQNNDIALAGRRVA